MDVDEVLGRAEVFKEKAKAAAKEASRLRREARLHPRYRPRCRKFEDGPIDFRKYALCRRCGGIWGPQVWEAERGDRGIPIVDHDDEPSGCTSPDFNVGAFIEAGLRRFA